MPPSEAVERNMQSKELRALRERQRTADQNLRSSREVTNYYIEASDGDIGHIEDFMVDDSKWAIRYVVVDTKNWWPGKKVVVSPQWISSVNWNDTKAHVDLTREQIKQAPAYDSDAVMTRDYEERVHQYYYRRGGYW